MLLQRSRCLSSALLFSACTLSLSLAASACGSETKSAAPEAQDAGGEDDEGGANAPLSAKQLTWTWFEFPDAYCRDGSKASIALSINEKSDNLMIFLEGGGSCFDALTCLANPASVIKMNKTKGVFNRDNDANPVKDWNFVYVPYCTGDAFSGTNPEGEVPGVSGKQMFVGYTNMSVFLKRIAPTFPDVKQVLLTGSSAGGFGASANTPQVTRAFPDARGILIDDSGPAMSSQYLTTCLQKRWREMWGLDASMLAECGADCPNEDDYVLDYSLHLAKENKDVKSGMIESAADGIIRRYFGVGMDNCTGNFLSDSMPAKDFEAGLIDFREAISEYPNFYTYFPPGEQHTWLGDDKSFFTGAIGDTKLIDWFTAIIEDKPASHAGP